LIIALTWSSSVAGQSLRDLSQRPVVVVTDAEKVKAQKARDHADQDALNTATWVYISAAAADWSVTAVCAKVICGDTHTQTGFLYGIEKPAAAIPLALALDAVIVIGVRELVAPDHPKIARALLYGTGAVRLVFVANKVNDLREHAQRSR